ncbi:hypothetical protein TSUD_36440 [Trifolium subterraneum]|uniref:PARP alpha-helical domain-containing protein n=1 Tax=Trifolium subterraneum TaxID=3900 RepID=A0A2Z6P3Q0_TRISU|nr:hypothetical protein TSUD_36440 [Trifolium subterraneum]
MEERYNANKLPLGKLSKSTIFKGYKVLKRLSDAIDRFDMKALEQLSGDTIFTRTQLKVEALAEIEVATKSY